MSVKVMGIVWEADLPQREKFVLLAYADHADHEGYNVFPSVGLIAWKTGYSERSIQRITAKLKADNILIEDGVSKYGTNRYQIDINAIPRLSPYGGGDNLTPPIYGGDILSGGGDNLTGDNLSGVTQLCHRGGDTAVSGGGDTAMSPDPSLTVIKPSLVYNPATILFKASNLPAFPADQLEWSEVISSMVETYGEERTTQALKVACNRWNSTKNKNGRPYKKTDLRWINWAVEELAHQPADLSNVNFTELTPEQRDEYIKQKYGELEG